MRTIVAVIAAIVIVGGGAWLIFGRDNKSNPPMQMSNPPAASASSQKPVATDSVSIENFAFSPASITVKKGTTVTWTNKDSTGHTVTQDDNSPAGSPGLDSKLLNQGDSYSATFNSVGTFKYHCSIHPDMTGSVTVTN